MFVVRLGVGGYYFWVVFYFIEVIGFEVLVVVYCGIGGGM